jgi:hypothetical protein
VPAFVVNTTITPSPSRLSMMPPWRPMIGSISPKYRFSSATILAVMSFHLRIFPRAEYRARRSPRMRSRSEPGEEPGRRPDGLGQHAGEELGPTEAARRWRGRGVVAWLEIGGAREAEGELRHRSASTSPAPTSRPGSPSQAAPMRAEPLKRCLCVVAARSRASGRRDRRARRREQRRVSGSRCRLRGASWSDPHSR